MASSLASSAAGTEKKGGERRVADQGVKKRVDVDSHRRGRRRRAALEERRGQDISSKKGRIYPVGYYPGYLLELPRQPK